VLSATGHLSNRDCGQLLQRALAGSDRRRTIWLAHLSATNNRPDLARATVAAAFGSDAHLHEIVALPRRDPGPIWSSEPVVRTVQLGFSQPELVSEADRAIPR